MDTQLELRTQLGKVASVAQKYSRPQDTQSLCHPRKFLHLLHQLHRLLHQILSTKALVTSMLTTTTVMDTAVDTAATANKILSTIIMVV